MDRFPLRPSAAYTYARNWVPRAGGHWGTDIFADRGTPVVAVERGIARSSSEPKGGTVVYLQGRSGTSYFLGHLDSAVVPPNGTPVNAGDVIGTVGSTGNAVGKPPHIHFQIRYGNDRFDPFDRLRSVDPHRDNPPFSLMHLVVFFGAYLFLKG